VATVTDRYVVLLGFGELPADASVGQRFARRLAESKPKIMKVAHDSGDPQVVYHCPACGSGQVIARSDGTIECGFCKMCFTVQVQPRYPAFPQTINGEPIQVPGMGPQWPGQDDEQMQQAQDAAEGIPVDDPNADDGNPFADQGAADEDGGDEEDSGDDGNPFAKKKSYRTASGVYVDPDAFLRHVALEAARDREKVLTVIRSKIGVR
jgi:ribosomal protein L37AE/L43A